MIDTSKVYTSNNFGDFKIVNYESSKKVTIEFLDTGSRLVTKTYNITLGNVKCKLTPSVYGVGFVGVGKYRPSKNRKPTKVYQTWRSMMNRCYGKPRLERSPTYKGCTVCDEWHNFQNFGAWFDENYIDGFQLDKDIKIKGNKVYSPKTCMFVSNADNTIEAHAKHYKVKPPQGGVVSVYNMAEFCRNNNLNNSAMTQVCLGNIKHHKGWTKG